MNALLLDGYAKVSVLIAIIDILLAVKAWKKNKTTGHYFAYACIGAAVVDISYLISILMHEYLCVSIMSSIYFATIDVMLLCLVIFTVYYTKGSFSPAGKRLLAAGKIYTLFEIAVFAINPFLGDCCALCADGYDHQQICV